MGTESALHRLRAMREGSRPASPRSLAEALLESELGDRVLVCGLVEADGGLAIADPWCTDPEWGERFVTLHQRWMRGPGRAFYRRHLAHQSMRGDAANYRALVPDAREADFVEEVWAHLGVADVARLLLVDGDTIVAWVGVARPIGAAPFTEEELTALGELGAPLTRSLRAGPRLAAPAGALPADLVCDGEGEIRWISPHLEPRLAPELREFVRGAVARAGRGWPMPIASGEVAAEVRPLLSEHAQAALVRLTEARPARIHALHRLTGRQLGVARLAARGETNPRIGEALGISSNTVKSHLSEVFARLGVSTRVELARLLGEDDLEG